MGRAKLKMELITKERSRITTFKKRKEGLIRKLQEFTTLCDVPACMIVYGPNQEKGSGAEPDIWPQDPDEVRRMIDVYEAKNKECRRKNYGLSDFLQERKRKVESELEKLRKKNVQVKYPTRPEELSVLSEGELRNLGVALSSKVEFVKARIEILKKAKQEVVSPSPSLCQGLYNNANYHQKIHDPVMMMNQRNPIEMLMMNCTNCFLESKQGLMSPSPNMNPCEGFYNTLNYHQEEIHPMTNQQESMRMLLMNGVENNCGQFDGDNMKTFCELMSEPMISQPVALDNGPTMLPPAPEPQPPYMPWMDMAPQPPYMPWMDMAPQLPLQSYSMENHGHQHCYGQGSFVQYQMMNQGLGYLQ